jgi:hypothetical protein
MSNGDIEKYANFYRTFHGEDASKRLDYSVQYAQQGLKAIFLLNSGAIIALLTFIGNKDVNFHMETMKTSFLWYSLGSFSIILAYFGAYFSQSYYFLVSASRSEEGARIEAGVNMEGSPAAEDKSLKCFALKGLVANAVAVVGSLLSFGFFVVGCFNALSAFK